MRPSQAREGQHTFIDVESCGRKMSVRSHEDHIAVSVVTKLDSARCRKRKRSAAVDQTTVFSGYETAQAIILRSISKNARSETHHQPVQRFRANAQALTMSLPHRPTSSSRSSYAPVHLLDALVE